MSNYSKIIDGFMNTSSNKIAIFRPDNLNLSKEEDSFYVALRNAIENENTYIDFIGEDFLYSYEGMCTGLVDIIIIPDLTQIPDRAHYWDSGRDSFMYLKKYLDLGGALLLSSSDMFMSDFDSKERNSVFYYFSGKDDYFRKTTSYLGIKPYQADVTPEGAQIDTEMISSLPSSLGIGLSPKGVFCCTGSERIIPNPLFGHCFPERYEVQRNYPVIRGVDHIGRYINTSVVFTQNWETGSRMCVMADNSDRSLMNPSSPYFSSFLKEAIAFCLNKVFLSFIEPEYACYKESEPVIVRYTIKSFYKHPVAVSIEVKILDEQGVVFYKKIPIEISGDREYTGEVTWPVLEFRSDYYEIEGKVLSDKKIISKATNGFSVWKDSVANAGTMVSTSGKFFTIDCEPKLITGTNYYESTIGELMWIRPNIKKLHDDLKAMSISGINFVRIHYHHTKWFLDYLQHAIGAIPEYYQQLNHSYLPDEKTLRVLDAHIYLCQKFRIIYGGDLLSLRPSEMGDPRGWYGTTDFLWFEEKIVKQQEFVSIIMKRYKDVPLIAWDLYNEPFCVDDTTFREWAKRIRETARDAGDMHLITVGTDRPERYDDILDFYSEHAQLQNISLRKTGTNKPEIIQEAFLPRSIDFEGDSLQENDMRQGLIEIFRSGFTGFVPWQWTNQARLKYGYQANLGEEIDDKHGCLVRDDGTVKPAGKYYRDFISILSNITFLGYQNGKFQTDQGFLEFYNGKREELSRGEYYFLHHNESVLFAGVARQVILWKSEPIVESDVLCDIWFFVPDKEGIHASKRFYLKVDRECTLRFHPRTKIDKVELLGSISENGFATAIQFSNCNGIIEIKALDWYKYYWLCIEMY